MQTDASMYGIKVAKTPIYDSVIEYWQTNFEKNMFWHFVI